jgi:hypothetical protein
MKPDANKTLGSARQMASYLLHDGKKVGMAMALVAVMAVMWLRVLTGQKPTSAAATAGPAPQTAEAPKPQRVMRFVELPVQSGRNDRIHRNFFTTDDWSRFSKGSGSQRTNPDPEVQKIPLNQRQEGVARLAGTLELEAVLWSADPQAFVNDRLVRIGDTLALRDGADSYPFEVVEIQKDAVIVTCGDSRFTLKLSPPTDVRK